MSLRDEFEKHVEARSVCWVEEMRARLFERNKAGQYTWQGLESRFQDFQAGHAAGLEDAAAICDNADKSAHPADLADAIRAMKEQKK